MCVRSRTTPVAPLWKRACTINLTVLGLLTMSLFGRLTISLDEAARAIVRAGLRFLAVIIGADDAAATFHSTITILSAVQRLLTILIAARLAGFRHEATQPQFLAERGRFAIRIGGWHA